MTLRRNQSKNIFLDRTTSTRTVLCKLLMFIIDATVDCFFVGNRGRHEIKRNSCSSNATGHPIRYRNFEFLLEFHGLIFFMYSTVYTPRFLKGNFFGAFIKASLVK